MKDSITDDAPRDSYLAPNVDFSRDHSTTRMIGRGLIFSENEIFEIRSFVI